MLRRNNQIRQIRQIRQIYNKWKVYKKSVCSCQRVRAF